MSRQRRLCRDSGSARKPSRPKRKAAAAASKKEASSDLEAESPEAEDEEGADDASEDATPGPSGRGTAANRSSTWPSEQVTRDNVQCDVSAGLLLR